MTQRGRVHTFKRRALGQGFGFVRGENGDEYFFPEEMLSKWGIESLRRGDAVEFESRVHNGRRQVRWLRRLDAARLGQIEEFPRATAGLF
jgi:cold shock CspA family protein